MDGLAGVTVIVTRVGAPTVRTVLPLTLPTAAVMVVLPVATEAARPEAAFTVATPVLELVQVIPEAIGCTPPSV